MARLFRIYISRPMNAFWRKISGKTKYTRRVVLGIDDRIEFVYHEKEGRTHGRAYVFNRKSGVDEITYIQHNRFHNSQGPCNYTFRFDYPDKVYEEQYLIRNKRHRYKKPAYIRYRLDGSVEEEKYYWEGNEVSETFFDIKDSKNGSLI